MFGFGKRVKAAKAEVKKFENRDLMEAMVGGCALVAFADGSCTEEELKKLEAVLAGTKALEGFGTEVQTTLMNFTNRLRTAYRSGRLEIMREIADVKNDQREKEDVLVAMITIAEADGDIGEAEMKVLTEVARALGLNIEQYLDA